MPFMKKTLPRKQPTQKRRKKSSPMRSEWVRFESYEIRGGYIRPTADALRKGPQRYDPWKQHAEAVEGRDDRRRMALGLDRLGNSLIERGESLRWFEDPSPLTTESEKAVIDWCNQYGLLGLLPHQSLSITLHPIYSAVAGSPGWAFPVLETWVRAGTEWHGTSMRELPVPETKGRRKGLPVPPSDVPTYWKSAGALMKDLDGNPEWRTLEDSWGRFFPDVPLIERKRFPYPIPYDNEFWQLYSEPLFDFVEAARLLSNCGKAVSESDQARSALNALAEPVATTLTKEKGALVQVFESPSLLGDLATMMIATSTKNRIGSCDECGQPFATPRYQRRFCCDNCANTYHVRHSQHRNDLLVSIHSQGPILSNADNHVRLEDLAAKGFVQKIAGSKHSYELTPLGIERAALAIKRASRN